MPREVHIRENPPPNAIPAKLAGVKDLVIITPVKADGKVNPVIIAAAKVSGVDTIY